MGTLNKVSWNLCSLLFFFFSFYFLVMYCLNALALPELHLYGTSIFFTYLFLCQSIKEITTSSPRGGAWKHQSVRVHKGSAGKVSDSKNSYSFPPMRSHFSVSSGDLRVYFHLGWLWCCQEGIKGKLILCHSFIRGQL